MDLNEISIEITLHCLEYDGPEWNAISYNTIQSNQGGIRFINIEVAALEEKSYPQQRVLKCLYSPPLKIPYHLLQLAIVNFSYGD